MRTVILLVAMLSAPLALRAQTEEVVAAPVRLPPGIVWRTNYDDPPIGSAEAIRGGTFNDFIDAYPLTFRLM